MLLVAVSAKAQWKAAIDFKWIRDNKDVIAANIMNRNSNANLNVVLDLYEEFLNLQKVRPFLVSTLYADFILPLLIILKTIRIMFSKTLSIIVASHNLWCLD